MTLCPLHENTHCDTMVFLPFLMISVRVWHNVVLVVHSIRAPPIISPVEPACIEHTALQHPLLHACRPSPMAFSCRHWKLEHELHGRVATWVCKLCTERLFKGTLHEPSILFAPGPKAASSMLAIPTRRPPRPPEVFDIGFDMEGFDRILIQPWSPLNRQFDHLVVPRVELMLPL